MERVLMMGLFMAYNFSKTHNKYQGLYPYVKAVVESIASNLKLNTKSDSFYSRAFEAIDAKAKNITFPRRKEVDKCHYLVMEFHIAYLESLYQYFTDTDEKEGKMEEENATEKIRLNINSNLSKIELQNLLLELF